ncbi:putative uncharacterized protein DDB_G0274435 isoform X2 [Pomacea canaliculata]|uniref:putative uncharacterized protein DDB_G0274435 isoform X2 n=1 Tax=Pomacea canaliculata TaxID=400727 RepID=UPI000D72A32F|nr:putative uncharacterized protein DDB_G0274435 isoform X2 [Pomacea canaliculata]
MQRGGFPVRAVVLAFFVIGTVYLLYLYNSTVGRLRDTEVTAERYRRGEETKVAELQEAIRSKDELQEKCDNDKREFTNRLNSLNQQHKMLKSQYDEHEVEQMRLEQEARRLRDEFEQVEAQRNNEYQQLRAEKELEITRLKDQIADLQRQNAKLQTETSNLQEQLQNGKKEAQYQQAVIQNMNTEIQALKQQQQVELAKAQMQGQQKGNSLNFQPEQQQQQQQQQQQLQFQKNLDSLGHQQFFPEQQKIVPPGAAGGLQNGIDNMNANVGGHQENLPQRNAEMLDAKDETFGKNLEDGKQVINQSSSILMSRNDSHSSLEGEMINPLDVQVSYSKIKGLNETGYPQVTTSASIIEEIDNVIQSAAQSNYSSGQSTTTVPNNVTAECIKKFWTTSITRCYHQFMTARMRSIFQMHLSMPMWMVTLRRKF